MRSVIIKRLFVFWQVMVCASYAMSAQIKPLFQCNPVLENPYGICSHISMPDRDYPFIDMDLRTMQDIGIGNVRTDFVMELNSGGIKQNYPMWDSVVSKCKEAGIEILPIVTEPKKGKDYSVWKKDITTIVKRYPNLMYWEVINEPDMLNERLGWPSVKEYSSLLTLSGNAVHSARRSAKVVSGGFGKIRDEYFHSFLNNGSPKSCDVLNVHFYSGCQAPESIIGALEDIHSTMQANNIRKPVWLTETGYSNVGYVEGDTDFYNETVPEALSRLGMRAKRVTVAVVSDPQKGYMLGGDVIDRTIFKKVVYVSLDEIAGLDPRQVQLLVPTMDESFPMQYFDNLLEYIRKGGTVALSGGSPLYYDYLLDGSGRRVAIGDACYKKAHIGILFPWTVSGTVKNVPENSRYMLASNLRGKDRLIPLVKSVDNGGISVGIYDFKSDFSGSIILDSRLSGKGISSNAQAERLPRLFLISFAYGVDKVFWYHLRSFEYDRHDYESHFGIVHSDFTPKPAYYTYKTLISMCPDGASRPVLEKIGEDVFVAGWTKPDGTIVKAVWTAGKDIEFGVESGKAPQMFDMFGKRMTDQIYVAGPAIKYLASDSNFAVFLRK